MSVEQADVIDGVGVRPDGTVEMLISDHLEWDGEQHLRLLESKVEAYANAVLSGQLVQDYPVAEGKPVCIKLVWQHVPNADAARCFEAVGEQLRRVGIEFTQATLPDPY
ncbi:MAG TPA: DUF6572 domain-containing protein [Allosphingosinicella sp.]|jgi:hypothetical protein